MSFLVDTGFLLATANPKDSHHKAVTETLTRIRDQILILPTPLIVELGILVSSRLGQQATSKYIANLEKSPMRIESLIRADFSRIGELLLQYQDARLDFVDAAITSIAERLNIRRILTVDQRDFRMIRPKHCPYFEILP